MTKLAIIVAAVGASAFGLSGCDSKAENQVERQAEAIDEYDEAKADLVETLDEGGPDEEAGEADQVIGGHGSFLQPELLVGGGGAAQERQARRRDAQVPGQELGHLGVGLALLGRRPDPDQEVRRADSLDPGRLGARPGLDRQDAGHGPYFKTDLYFSNRSFISFFEMT